MSIESRSGDLNKEKVERGTIRFNEMNELELEAFSKLVEKSRGVVRIFIHPRNYVGGSTYQEETAEFNGRPIALAEKPLNMLMAVATNENAPPIIIFENKSLFADTEEIFNREEIVSNLSHPLYLIQTLDNYPYIKLKDRDEPERDATGTIVGDYEVYLKEGMVSLIERLKSLGVKKVLVGGTDLEINEEGLDKCVGNFISTFKYLSDIELKVSAGTIPQGRDELRNAGYKDLL